MKNNLETGSDAVRQTGKTVDLINVIVLDLPIKNSKIDPLKSQKKDQFWINRGG